MSANKTRKNAGDIDAFLQAIDDPEKRRDAKTLLAMMQEVSGEPPAMWGSSIIGFGTYQYQYASGRKGEWALTGFSPRKANMTVYIMNGFTDYGDHLKRLGPHKTGKSCLYIKRLSDIDEDVLRAVIEESLSYMRTKYCIPK